MEIHDLVILSLCASNAATLFWVLLLDTRKEQLEGYIRRIEGRRTL